MAQTASNGAVREKPPVVGGFPPIAIADDEIRPHPGPQEAFLSSPADICIGGGSAGGGKTRALLMEPLRHIRVPDFNAVLFRRSFPQLEASGGPWAESEKLYPMTEADSAYMRWKWPSGATVRFSHLQHDKNRLDWKGAQIALILFDQLEDFLESQFWYLLSRNRSVCGVKPYVRATCNPVPADDEVGGWLHRLLDWWIDQDSGYPIMERAGKLRWFLRRSEALHWGDTKADLIAQFPDTDPSLIKSLSFVPMGIEDNPTLLVRDPAYVGLLEALPYVERMRLRHGNWNVRESTGSMFERMWFGFLPGVLADPPMARVRFWDCAGSAGKGDYTVGTRMARYADGTFVIEDVIRGQWAPGDVDKLIVHVAQGDGYGVRIREEQEPGSSGKAVIATHARLLVGYDYKGVINSGDKITRWKPLASQAQVGHVKIVMGAWNRDWLDEMSHVPDSAYDDCADSASGAFLDLTRYGPARIQRLDGF